MKIFFIRHGESEHNKYLKDLKKVENPVVVEKIHTTEVSLSEEGRQQIVDLAKQLPDQVDRIFTSNHMRVQESADILIQQKYPGVPVELREDLRECSMGELDGMTLEMQDEKMGRSFSDALNTNTYDFTPFGGESSKQFDTRVRSFLQDVASKPYEQIIVVTSNGFIKSVYNILLGKIIVNVLQHIRVKNATVHEFHITPDMLQ